jgi:hypothetical protein
LCPISPPSSLFDGRRSSTEIEQQANDFFFPSSGEQGVAASERGTGKEKERSSNNPTIFFFSSSFLFISFSRGRDEKKGHARPLEAQPSPFLVSPFLSLSCYSLCESVGGRSFPSTFAFLEDLIFRRSPFGSRTHF